MLGGDPEAFIIAPDGAAIPAHVFFPSKEQKLSVPEAGKIFRDGFAVEFNPNPSPNLATLIGNMAKLFAAAYTYLPRGYKLSAVSTVPIDLEGMVKDAPPDVMESGCSPSFNAYNTPLEPPSLRFYPKRHAGGHIHLSPLGLDAWPLDRPDLYPTLVMVMDAILGARIYEIMDNEPYRERCQVYGKWGEYREQLYPHGVRGLEYRVLGNEIWSHPALVTFAYGLARLAVLNLSSFHYGELVLGRLACQSMREVPGKLPPHANNCPFAIPGFYSPLTIRALRNVFAGRSKVIEPTLFAEWAEDSPGWRDWADEHKFPVPLPELSLNRSTGGL